MLETIWHYIGPSLAALVLAALGGLAIKRSNYKAIQDTAEGWEKAYKQKGEELTLLTERFGRLQARFEEQERRYNEIVTLNLTLQIELKARDITIAELKGQIGILESQVHILQKQLASFKP